MYFEVIARIDVVCSIERKETGSTPDVRRSLRSGSTTRDGSCVHVQNAVSTEEKVSGCVHPMGGAPHALVPAPLSACGCTGFGAGAQSAGARSRYLIFHHLALLRKVCEVVI